MIYDNFLIYGAGITGVSVARFLSKHNKSCYVYDDDVNKTKKVEFQNTKQLFSLGDFDFSKIDAIVVSPGLRTVFTRNKIVDMAEAHSKPIITDLDILQYYYKDSKYIGITGTNGKTTTCSLLSHVMKEAGLDVYLGGNIGIPMLDIDKKYDHIILELSSYQIENTKELYFDIGAIINVYPSHLDHHGDMQRYTAAKERLCQNSKYSLINDNLSKQVTARNINYFSTSNILQGGISIFKNDIYQNGKRISSIDDINNDFGFKIHPENICCVFDIASKIGIQNESILSSMKTYKPAAHRMEPVRTIGRISFINDSKATNIPAALNAITSYDNLVLIMGGKALSTYEGFEKFFLLKHRIQKVFLIGESAEFLKKKFDASDIENKISFTIQAAVIDAYKKSIQLTKNNKTSNFTVMLCPMHPSMDQFANFEERGDIFKNLVQSL